MNLGAVIQAPQTGLYRESIEDYYGPIGVFKGDARSLDNGSCWFRRDFGLGFRVPALHNLDTLHVIFQLTSIIPYHLC